MEPGDSAHPTTLRDYLQVVRRRKWIIAQALLLVPTVAVLVSLRQEPLYEATAEVLISRQNLAASLTGTVDPTLYQQAERTIQTQAELARVPEVARRVLDAAGLTGDSPREFLDRSSVAPKQNADLLTFKVRDPSASLAVYLATLYANEFRTYRRELDTDSIERARGEVEERLRELEEAGERQTGLYASLAEKEQQLRTLEALQTSNAYVVRSADDAGQVQPRPVRAGALGLALALLLGLGLAFVREALDTRIRTADELEHALGMPLLARIPEPPRRLRSDNKLSMLADPRGMHAETIRMLKMNLQFMKLNRDVRTIMVTSAVEQEGKSTTVANLALAFARAGESVALVDLDLRRPYLDRFFDLRRRAGLTQVVLGQVTLDEALTPIAVPSVGDSTQPRIAPASSTNGGGNGAAPPMSPLFVLGAGPTPPNAGELVATEMLAQVLEQLRERFEYVLIDAPPALQVGDAMAMSAKVDGVFVVTRMNVVRRPMIRDLRRVLETSPAAKLGFAVTGAESEDSYGYGGYSYGYEPKLDEVEGAVAMRTSK